MASFVNDSLYTAFILNTGNFLGFGLLGFIIIQSGILGRRFSRAFDRGEALQEELAEVNANLETENALYRQSQASLESALAEKDLLLREVHHRVKNSLQIVSSTLGLQSHRSDDPAALEVYAMARSRIRAISLVHEKLYGLKSAEVLDLGEYARDLVAQLSDSFGSGPRGATLKVDAAQIQASVDDCIDFGLILTELVANACKHATKSEYPLSVAVRIWREGPSVVLLVEDDGPGFPEGFDPGHTATLGYRVVWSLARKHGGEALVLPGPGARIQLRLAMDDFAGGAEGQLAGEATSQKERT
jgi:two-component sensor histidine kinase